MIAKQVIIIRKLTGRKKLPKPVDETLRITGLAASEVLKWPGVTENPMFSLRCFHRGTVAFAMLPGARAGRRIVHRLQNRKRDGLNRALTVPGEAWESAH